MNSIWKERKGKQKNWNDPGQRWRHRMYIANCYYDFYILYRLYIYNKHIMYVSFICCVFVIYLICTFPWHIPLLCMLTKITQIKISYCNICMRMTFCLFWFLTKLYLFCNSVTYQVPIGKTYAKYKTSIVSNN